MQHIKSIKKLSEIDSRFAKANVVGDTFSRVLNQFRLSTINKLIGGCKSRGISAHRIFQTLFILPFIGKINISSLAQSGFTQYVIGGKDTYYEFLKNPQIPWRKIVLLFAWQFVLITRRKSHDQAANSPKRMIVDDTLLEKSGKKIEKIGKVFDHGSHKHPLGMKLLVLSWWDGKSMIPLNFSLHNEPRKDGSRGLKPKELKNQYRKQRSKTDASCERVQEVEKSKSKNALTMIGAAVKKGFSPQYVLADSWFISDDFIRGVINLKRKAAQKIHLIGQIVTNRTCRIGRRTYSINNLHETKRKQIKYCKKLKCSYISLQAEYKGTPIKLFLVRMNGQQSWHALISTDCSLGFVKAMKYYQIRWSIEVFFRDAKQYLYLGKCQSTDLDSHFASISLCFMNYIALALAKRFEDYESLGAIFKAFKDLLLSKTLITKLWELLTRLYVKFLVQWGVVWEVFVQQLINANFLDNQVLKILNFLFIKDQDSRKIVLN